MVKTMVSGFDFPLNQSNDMFNLGWFQKYKQKLENQEDLHREFMHKKRRL